ncbi:FH protein interacting protein FIP2 isoform X1 [Selaginella moellendorffii]|uniref:FH protein interacting protein FIP2 isoform X1 n=2 Tax=Selaginella moellendorffii TaxID=88036 RepID=UPI000D1C4EE9|nr:FH protein interacting protein FIP2 isoform X1 [Selaginella moellendorffii]XP_024543558.1 FH protein interacting protein FIP2 isoform X1 [Selaginella moellendorffii]|eukprot:XP_024542575.1 FH protein interacting protein FIP2 isoform X1 [Selaginella moellendorffii]
MAIEDGASQSDGDVSVDDSCVARDEEAAWRLAIGEGKPSPPPQDLDSQMRDLQEPAPGVPSIVHLNVGGMQFTTTVDTLTHRDTGSMLAIMFSGRHRLHIDANKGSVFIDRDGTHFRHILNYLRDGVTPALDTSSVQELLREAEYYQLSGLIEALTAVSNKKDEDDEDTAELTRKEVIKCLQTKRVRLRGVNLSGQNLSKLDLSGVDFSNGRLISTFFSRANLHSANFRDSAADYANFHNAILRESVFVGACLRGSVLSGANLQSANMQDACLADCSLLGADLRTAHLQNADLSNANFAKANLEGANLKGARLNGADLRSANLQRAYLAHADLRGTNLDGANLGGANTSGMIR